MTTMKYEPAKSRMAILLWVVVILCTGLSWDAWGENQLPLSQNTSPVPPNHLQHVKDSAPINPSAW